MEIIQCLSSVVFAGSGFAPGILDVSEFSEELGVPDFNNTVVMPMMAHYSFVKTGFHILIEPVKIDLRAIRQRDDAGTPELFPSLLASMATFVARQSRSKQDVEIRAIGYNASFVLGLEAGELSGEEYCQSNFFPQKTRQLEALEAEELVGNEAKLVYRWNDAIVNLEFAPHYDSDGTNLYLKVNIHHELDGREVLEAFESSYPKARDYIVSLPTRVQV
jgi:hypothetical protein